MYQAERTNGTAALSRWIQVLLFPVRHTLYAVFGQMNEIRDPVPVSSAKAGAKITGFPLQFEVF